VTEDQEERVAQLREMAQGHTDYFTPTENYIVRRRAEKATLMQIGQELDCTGSNVQRIERNVKLKMKRAQEIADGIVAGALYAKKQYDITVAYRTKNASEMLKLLLPHINEIKELAK
jgi:DNA-binding CsgD family transcriptional regulator